MSKTRVFGIRLDPRQAWAWKRLGRDFIRELIAPEGTCVQCGHRPPQINSRNSWFCFLCQDDLDQRQLLPPNQSDQLQKQNQELRTQIKRLHSQVKSFQNDSDQPLARQLTLFEDV